MAKKHTGRNVAIAAGITLAAVSAAAAYYLTGREGAKNRKALAAWAGKARQDVLREMKRLKAVNQKGYDAAIRAVLSRYRKMKNVDPKEIARLEGELKGHWRRIKGTVLRSVKAKKPARKKK